MERTERNVAYRGQRQHLAKSSKLSILNEMQHTGASINILLNFRNETYLAKCSILSSLSMLHFNQYASIQKISEMLALGSVCYISFSMFFSKKFVACRSICFISKNQPDANASLSMLHFAQYVSIRKISEMLTLASVCYISLSMFHFDNLARC